MKMILFGATGTTGSQMLIDALNAGHYVTAFVRDRSRLGVTNAQLTVLEGDVLNQTQVSAAVMGQEAVISTISEGLATDQQTQSRGMANLIKAMEQGRVKRLFCMGATGILQANKTEMILDQPWFPAQYKAVSVEHYNVYQQLLLSSLHWTQVCPPAILPPAR